MRILLVSLKRMVTAQTATLDVERPVMTANVDVRIRYHLKQGLWLGQDEPKKMCGHVVALNREYIYFLISTQAISAK